MDREYILNLPEGDEINNLVAEKVMGWHKGIVTFSDGSTFSGKEDWLDEKGRYRCGIKKDDGWYEDDEDFNLLHWHPSESILWAWEVVEKMEDSNFCLDRNGDLCPSGLWQCIIKGEVANADTPSLAICRAALLAMEYSE